VKQEPRFQAPIPPAEFCGCGWGFRHSRLSGLRVHSPGWNLKRIYVFHALRNLKSVTCGLWSPSPFTLAPSDYSCSEGSIGGNLVATRCL